MIPSAPIIIGTVEISGVFFGFVSDLHYGLVKLGNQCTIFFFSCLPEPDTVFGPDFENRLHLQVPGYFICVISLGQVLVCLIKIQSLAQLPVDHLPYPLMSIRLFSYSWDLLFS